MKKTFRFLSAIIIAIATITLNACSSDDEPGYDPEQPIVGTWIVQEVKSPSYVSYIGGMLGNEEQWKQDFINEWTGKKLTFKASQIENGVVYIKKYDQENPSGNDRTISFEISEADATTLTAYYTELIYMSQGNRMCRTTASMTMKRK